MKRCQPWGNSKTCESTPGTPAWGNRKKASRGGRRLVPAFWYVGGWGVQGTFLVSKARETFPQDPWDGQGRKAYALTLGLCRKTSFSWTALRGLQSPAKLCAGTYAFLLFSAISACFPKKTWTSCKKIIHLLEIALLFLFKT